MDRLVCGLVFYLGVCTTTKRSRRRRRKRSCLLGLDHLSFFLLFCFGVFEFWGLCDDVGMGTASVLFDLGDTIGDLDEISEGTLGFEVVVVWVGLETLNVHADRGSG